MVTLMSSSCLYIKNSINIDILPLGIIDEMQKLAKDGILLNQILFKITGHLASKDTPELYYLRDQAQKILRKRQEPSISDETPQINIKPKLRRWLIQGK